MGTPNSELLQSFKDFFDRKSTIPAEPTQCELCGSTMEYFDTQFWFFESQKEWTIPLPYCPLCDPQPQKPSRA